MATGPKANNMILIDGVSWEDRYAIDADGLTNATRSNFKVVRFGGEGEEFVICRYTGADALTLSEFNNFPVGTLIFANAVSTPCVYMKTAATTWKLQAINT